jgi:hypothetical protein
MDAAVLGEPVFLGFLPKRRILQPDWLAGSHVEEIASLSRCFAKTPERMFTNEWHGRINANGFVDYTAAVQEIPAGEEDNYFVYAYRGYRARIEQHRMEPLTPDNAPFHLRNWTLPDLTPHTCDFLGYDIVAGFQAFYGCSPLSCTHMARRFPVNRWCLMESLGEALAAALTFDASNTEPPPYFLVEVWKANVPTNAVREPSDGADD